MRESLARLHGSLQAEHASYALLADIVQSIQRHQPAMLAKQTAYSLLYAVPSVLITLVSLAAIVDKNTGAGISDTLHRAITARAPADLQPLLESLVQRALVETSESTAIIATVVSLAIAVWGGAGGVGALVYAVNQVYDIRDDRSFITSAVLNVGLMLLGGVLVVAAFLLLAFGRRIGEWLAAEIGHGSALVNVFLSGPIWAVVLLFCSLLLLYWFALDTPKSLKWLLPGAAAATLAIAVIFGALGLILSYSNPGSAYGAAGSVLILLWSLYILSVIVVVGAIVNAVLGRRHDRTLNQGLHSSPEKQLGRHTIAISEYR